MQSRYCRMPSCRANIHAKMRGCFVLIFSDHRQDTEVFQLTDAIGLMAVNAVYERPSTIPLNRSISFCVRATKFFFIKGPTEPLINK